MIELLGLLLLALGLWWLGGRANRADWGSPWLNRLDGLNRLFCRYYHGLSCEPLPLPARGGALVVANHISGLDPLLMASLCERPLRFLIAEEEYRRFGLRWFFRATGCIPVDRQQRPATALRRARKALQAGEVVALFPHGRIHAKRRPARIKGGVVRLAQGTAVPIYPLWLDGVTGRGLVLAAVFLPSRVRVRTYPPLYCGADDYAACMQRLHALLNGPRQTSEEGQDG